MHGYGFNNHKLKRFTREKIPGFFVQRSGVMDVPGVVCDRGRGTGAGEQGQGDKNGIFSRALRKLQRKPCKITSKNGNFTQNTKIFA